MSTLFHKSVHITMPAPVPNEDYMQFLWNMSRRSLNQYAFAYRYASWASYQAAFESLSYAAAYVMAVRFGIQVNRPHLWKNLPVPDERR